MPIYMKVPGVQGTGKGKHCGWIVLESCQIGSHSHISSTTASGTNREANAPPLYEIVVTKSLDISSTNLFRLTLDGRPIKVVIDFVAEESKNDVPTMSIELENTLVTNYATSGSGGDSRGTPMESLALNFSKVTYSTTPTESAKDAKATPNRAQWDLFTAGSKGA